MLLVITLITKLLVQIAPIIPVNALKMVGILM